MTKKQRVLKLLKTQWVSPLVALEKAGCLSLSQRVGELKREGVEIQTRWARSQGARFCEYRVAK